MFKKWFDSGWGLLGQFKYAIGLFGIAEITIFKSYKYIVMIGIVYAIICFVLGWTWLRFGFYETETEINNMFNPFIKEMRDNKLLFGTPNK